MESFVWTEALGCAEILPPMLQSFNRHHPQAELNVFVYEEDVGQLQPFDFVNLHPIKDSGDTFIDAADLREAFAKGHSGTALLWSAIIKQFPGCKLVHFDSDTVFLGAVLEEILNPIASGYSISGPRRPYKYGPKLPYPQKLFQGMMPDAVHTYAFGFNAMFLQSLSRTALHNLIVGAKPRSAESIFRPNLDFFDRVTRILGTEGDGIYYLGDPEIVVGKHDPLSTFNRKLITFAAVGTGAAVWKSGEFSALNSYQKFALRSFSTYSRELLDFDPGLGSLEDPTLEYQLSKLDRETWSLRDDQG